MTVKLTGGRINSISMASPDTQDPTTAGQPAGEIVSFTFQTVTWSYYGSTPNSFTDDLSN
jgi:type VI protein secretion system component Hcp